MKGHYKKNSDELFSIFSSRKTRSKYNMQKLRVSTNTAMLWKKVLKKLAREVLSPIHQRFEYKCVSGIYNCLYLFIILPQGGGYMTSQVPFHFHSSGFILVIQENTSTEVWWLPKLRQTRKSQERTQIMRLQILYCKQYLFSPLWTQH